MAVFAVSGSDRDKLALQILNLKRKSMIIKHKNNIIDSICLYVSQEHCFNYPYRCSIQQTDQEMRGMDWRG
jgi:hypothetical protein